MGNDVEILAACIRSGFRADPIGEFLPQVRDALAPVEGVKARVEPGKFQPKFEFQVCQEDDAERLDVLAAAHQGKLQEIPGNDVNRIDPDRVVEGESGRSKLGSHDPRENQDPGSPSRPRALGPGGQDPQVLICLFTKICLEEIPMLAGDQRLLNEIVLERVAASLFPLPRRGSAPGSTPPTENPAAFAIAGSTPARLLRSHSSSSPSVYRGPGTVPNGTCRA